MKINPVGDQILVKLVEVEEISEGGIVLHTQHQQKREQDGQYMGEVLSFGPSIFMDKYDNIGETPEERAKFMGVKIGDTVIFHRYDGEKPPPKDFEDYRLIVCNCIIATVES